MTDPFLLHGHGGRSPIPRRTRPRSDTLPQEFSAEPSEARTVIGMLVRSVGTLDVRTRGRSRRQIRFVWVKFVPTIGRHEHQLRGSPANCLLMLAVGSSLQVEPVASLCAVAVNAGSRLVIINRDPAPYDHLAVEVIREPIGTAVPRICATLSAASQAPQERGRVAA